MRFPLPKVQKMESRTACIYQQLKNERERERASPEERSACGALHVSACVAWHRRFGSDGEGWGKGGFAAGERHEEQRQEGCSHAHLAQGKEGKSWGPVPAERLQDRKYGWRSKRKDNL